MIVLLLNRFEAEVSLAAGHSLVDGGEHGDRSFLLGSKLLDNPDAFVDLLQLGFQFVLALDVSFKLLGFFLFARELGLCGCVRVVGPKVIDADGDQKHHKRAREHEELLSTARGDFCLLHRNAMLGGPSK
jgi:hypothetical protein